MSIVPREARDPEANAKAVIGNVEMKMEESRVVDSGEKDIVEFSEKTNIYEIAGETLINGVDIVKIPAFDGEMKQTQKTDNEQQK